MRSDKTLNEYIELVGRLGGVFLASFWLCPRCLGTYKSKRDESMCGCGVEGVSISSELVDIVRSLIKLGLTVTYADCATYRDRVDEGKITQIDIGFRDNYPAGLFYDLPPDWLTFEYHPINQPFGTKFIGLTCLCKHHISECDDEIVAMDKKLCIDNLDIWIADKDALGTKSLLLLGGYKVEVE